MTSLLASVLNGVNTLLARLTSAWAAQLDATISSRAPLSSALSTTDWTTARAGKLDYLDGAISVISPIKSVQQGLIDTTSVSSGSLPELRYVDVTISSITIAKALVIHDVCFGQDNSAAATALLVAQGGRSDQSFVQRARAYLVNSTTLRLYAGRQDTYNAASGRWRVVEYK